MADRPKPGYYAVIPADVRYDGQIPPNAKLLYGEISALIGSEGYCYAGNPYFAELYGMTEETISRLVGKLERAGHIKRIVDRDNTGQIIGRRLYLRVSLPEIHLDNVPLGFLEQNTGGGIDEKINTYPQKNQEGIDKKIKETNTSINIYTPYKPPKGGDDNPASPKKRRGDYKTQAETLPERFEGFWTFYRKACPPSVNPGNRQKAIRAWDKLAPDEELVTQMARALARQTKSEQWTKGIGIPHASTWLNNHGWEDDWGEAAQMENTPEPEAQPTGDWL